MLFLHIGTHKTGTSALQSFLASRADALDERGIHYVRSGLGKGMAHHALSWSVRDIQEVEPVVWEKTRREIAGHTTSVLSSEAFWFADAAKVKAELEGIADIRIVIYLRRQDKYLQSLYKQAVTSGRKLDFFAWRERHIARGDYLAIIRSWAEAFGRDAIAIRPYERNGLRIDTVADFFDVLGTDVADLLARRKSRSNNPSPRLELLELFRAFNQLGLDIPHEKLFWAVLAGNRDYGRSADILSFEQCCALMREFDDGNKALAAEFHHDPSTPLFPEMTPFAPPEFWSWDRPEYFQMTADFLGAAIEIAKLGGSRPGKAKATPGKRTTSEAEA